MNRLLKILTLGLEKKRAWQLPIIAAFLLLVAAATWWYANWLGAGSFNVHLLVTQSHTEDLAYVLRWRPDKANDKDEWRKTPLHRAAESDRTKMVKLLIQAGAEVNARDRLDAIPLHKAAPWGPTDTAKALLEAGADVNAKDYLRRTPLHWAAWVGRTDMVKVLIKAGAEVNVKDATGQTPLDRTKTKHGTIDSKKQAKCAELLRKHGAKTGAELDAEAEMK